ncbi:hypothetical protein Tco_0203981, partial [Tanacetum coccineum]
DEAGNHLKKVEFSNDYDSEDEVASVDNDMARFMASERVGFGTMEEFVCNSFKALNIKNPIIEEVETGNKASTSRVQEKCVLMDDDGKPIDKFDYSGNHGRS